MDHEEYVTVTVRVELFRPTTESNLEFYMKVREKNVERVNDYIELQYPDWILQSILVEKGN